MILYAKNTANKITRGEPLNTCLVEEGDTYSIQEWIHNDLKNKLLYLETGEVRISDTKNWSDKENMVKKNLLVL